MQEIFRLFLERRIGDLQFIRTALLAQFGPEPPRVRGTLDDQFPGSIPGSRTRDHISRRAFMRLASHFHGDWNLLAAAPENEIFSLIHDVTFAREKAACLMLVWRKSQAQNGVASFSHVARMPVEMALYELEKNPGIGRKTSAATLNFSEAHGRAFVVDTHVLRVLRRFGFVGVQAQTVQAFDAVRQAAAGMNADNLFELHWHLKRLGQKFCAHSQAACGRCPLSACCLRRLESYVRIVPHAQSQECRDAL